MDIIIGDMYVQKAEKKKRFYSSYKNEVTKQPKV